MTHLNYLLPGPRTSQMRDRKDWWRMGSHALYELLHSEFDTDDIIINNDDNAQKLNEEQKHKVSGLIGSRVQQECESYKRDQ